MAVAQAIRIFQQMEAGAASRLLTGRVLRAAWQYLIPTWGLTLIYLNFHFCARHFAHRRGFTPLGSEWKLWRTLRGWPSFGLKYAELIALLFLDLLVVLIILLVVSLVILVAMAITDPVGFCSNVDPAVAAITGAALGAAGLAAGLSCAAIGVVAG